MSERLTVDELVWMRGLARSRIRRTEKSLMKFWPKEGQRVEDAAAVKAHLEANLAWQRKVLEHIDALIAEQ